MRLTVSRHTGLKSNCQPSKILPLKMQINIHRHKVLRCFKCHYFRRISYLEKDLASVLFPGSIPINFGPILKNSGLSKGFFRGA